MIARRRFIGGLAAAGTAGVIATPRVMAAEALRETTTVRLGYIPAACDAPVHFAADLLHAEGFSDVRFVTAAPGRARIDALGRGEFDFTMSFAVTQISALDADVPITIVTSVHAGCYELFAHEGIRSIADLKGKRIGAESILLSLIAAYVGLDPKKDLNLVDNRSAQPLELFAEGKLDAYLAFPPENQELHARKAGHVILRTAVDRPWSQYFCCMMAANREYAARYPVATKRVIRAVLKAADLCANKPEGAARMIVEGGFTERYDYALQTLTDNPYNAWREYDPEDTLRFYALRLHELGMIKNSPQKIIANGADSRTGAS
jgi:NitT/TauT family transport system substrate-binding protein